MTHTTREWPIFLCETDKYEMMFNLDIVFIWLDCCSESLSLRLLSHLHSGVRCCSSRRGLPKREVADNEDKDIELEEVEKSFGDQLEEDPGYFNKQFIINDEDAN